MKRARFEPIDIPLAGAHLVEASAGTGKTHAIATLYVRMLLEKELEVGQILVVTYTNPATAELRVRIRRRLRDTLDALDAGAWPEDDRLDRFVRRRRDSADHREDRRRLLAALHAFDEAAIFTIHGFCQRVLQENAVESGVAFDTELLTNITGLVDDIAKDFWVSRLHDVPVEVVRGLEEEKVKIDDLRRIAFTVVTHPGIEILPPLTAMDLEDDPLRAQALRFQREFAEYARDELRRRKEAARLQSFDDLLQRLRDALAAPGGEELAAIVRRRYHAAMIDEFQDTDPVQYEIFERIYGTGGLPVFLIGDPKQAIYGFRGADVFTYMGAKSGAAETQTLLVNRRSDPKLLQAINTIFERAAPAFLFEAIEYEGIEPFPAARDRLGGTRAGKAPFEILFVARTHFQIKKNSPTAMINKGHATPFITEAVAAKVAAMLSEGATLNAGDAERPVLPSDIAVLVRKNAEAAAMQEALRRRGVHAVLQTDATVFETNEAVAVDRVLRALASPGDNRLLRAALASSLVGFDAARLDAFESDERQWDEWAQRFRAWRDRWLERGFIAAFRGVLDELDVERRILGRVGGERQLTDILHLVELLHRAGVEQRLGPEALVQWLAQMRGDETAREHLVGEAARLRLESDEDAVKLVTIHRSKGLEYPIVLVPFSWDGLLLRKDDKKAPRFHDEADGNRLKLDLGALPEHLEQATYESLAENLRLLYVAFTRAKHYCGVVWGAIHQGETSALAYLLHQDRGVSGRARISATSERTKRLTDDAMSAELHALADASGGAVACVELAPSPAVLEAATGATEALPAQVEARRRLFASWRMSSFSALIAAPAAALSSPDEEGIDHDAHATATATGEGEHGGAPAPPPAELPFAALSGGARSGELVHRLLEKLDFTFEGPVQLRERLEPLLPRSGAARAALEALTDGIGGVLDTPLGGDAGSLRLRELRPERRLNELEFLLPVGGDGSRLTVAGLAAVFERHARTAAQAQYAQRLRHLGFTALEGYLKGFIDLVFEHGGRWYVVDYKTNQLGAAVADYAGKALEGAMAMHHYILQGHLYAVAVHRHLAARMRGYDYDRHFGGIYYLFLRGMSPRFPPRSGVWHVVPQRELIEDLSGLLAPAEAARAS
jgi:exodeoxyribonuclease V beta subunit